MEEGNQSYSYEFLYDLHKHNTVYKHALSLCLSLSTCNFKKNDTPKSLSLEIVVNGITEPFTKTSCTLISLPSSMLLNTL